MRKPKSQPCGVGRAGCGAAGRRQLTRDNVRRLQSALHELRECRRLIDEALKDEAA